LVAITVFDGTGTPVAATITIDLGPPNSKKSDMVHMHYAGTVSIDVGEVRFEEMRQNMERTFRHVADGKGLGFVIELDSTVATGIYTDAQRLDQVLKNLLSNAFKFTPSHGQVKVELTHSSQNSAEGTSHDAIEIKVIDTGIGIPQEKHLKIFDRFFQSDTPRSMVNQGSGIGLSITKEFVRIHGGTISVTSEPEKGSCFTIVLPIKKITEAADVHQIEEVVIVNTQIQEEMGAEPRGNKKPVLLLVTVVDRLAHDHTFRYRPLGKGRCLRRVVLDAAMQ